MAALSDKLADAYMNARPRYPIDWFTKLAARTGQHLLAWDVGTGNGQAAIGLAEYFEKVVATVINEAQLKRAVKQERISYHQTPTTISENQMVSLIGEDNSVDLIVAAQAVHYFDLTAFYNIAKRVLRKEGELIAVLVSNDLIIIEANPPRKNFLLFRFKIKTAVQRLVNISVWAQTWISPNHSHKSPKSANLPLETRCSNGRLVQKYYNRAGASCGRSFEIPTQNRFATLQA